MATQFKIGDRVVLNLNKIKNEYLTHSDVRPFLNIRGTTFFYGTVTEIEIQESSQILGIEWDHRYFESMYSSSGKYWQMPKRFMELEEVYTDNYDPIKDRINFLYSKSKLAFVRNWAKESGYA